MGAIMLIKTRIFELYYGNYKNLSTLAQVMEISVSQLYRVQEGKRNINQKFIVGAMKAFRHANLMSFFILPLACQLSLAIIASKAQPVSQQQKQRVKRTQPD